MKEDNGVAWRQPPTQIPAFGSLKPLIGLEVSPQGGSQSQLEFCVAISDILKADRSRS
ncbi:hypothetical protein [Aromatoleum bremense]|uniref:Transposase n=1 Tax=Aromatoleum bremense TaxID=76115 RepID=A0ABX1NW25_9RHOO|nr:hypothetical protein [Aromatoleum bremense]NMG15740.1 hypothetical protein [Aromatoleum bremense]